MKVRSPHLYAAVRGFCLAAFAVLWRQADQGGEIPFVIEEHGGGLYEYRPLLRDHVVVRTSSLAQLEDAQIALAELRREPAAAIFAHGDSADRTLFQAILVPMQGLESIDDLTGFQGLKDNGIAAVQRVLLARATSVDDAGGGHGFQTDQAEGF